mgnify:CR=1 FL=1
MEKVNLILNGTQELRTIVYIGEEEKPKEIIHQLKQIDEEEMEKLRNKEKTIFILKKEKKYYYTELKIKFNLYNKKLQKHLCGECKNCYPKKCLKVGDYGLNKKIEKYPFIEEGAEVINLDENQSSFLVISCDNFS